jgi:hypothetical protein
VGFNTGSDFDVAHDVIDFGPGVLVGGGETELSDALYALGSFSDLADSHLVANAVGSGWSIVALLPGVDAATLAGMSDDGSLPFEPSLNPGICGGPAWLRDDLNDDPNAQDPAGDAVAPSVLLS